MSELSPMMKQYFELKEKHKDCILFFRLGDFYEMFFEDAKIASKELDITLTGRPSGQEERAPMCGVPFHSAEQYIDKLVEKGYKVAICEQLEDAVAGKLVERDVVRIITAGTVTSANMLEDKRNNYLCSIYHDENGSGISFVDITTGELTATEYIESDSRASVTTELSRYVPSEILANESILNDEFNTTIKMRLNANIEALDSMLYNYEFAESKILNQFGANSVKESIHMTLSVGILLEYLSQTQKCSLPHISEVKVYTNNQFVGIDYSTRRNLEITATMREGKKRGTLLWVLDKTVTSMGGRCLRDWVNNPLLSCAKIQMRQSAVSELVASPIFLGELRELMSSIQDIARITSKIVTKNVLPRDLIALEVSLRNIPNIKNILMQCKSKLISNNAVSIDLLDDVASLISRAIVPSPPFTLKEGGIIQDGFNEDVDSFRKAMNEGTEWIAGIEAEERQKTGIKNLKIGFNKVFGYYIEVSKSNISNVPDRYVRKQTLANCERYITGKLKDIENIVLGAQERNGQLEYELFCDIRDRVAAENVRIMKTAHILAELDALCSLADVAAENGYVMPHVNLSDIISIKDGRHPVIEKIQSKTLFVPNDTYLSKGERLSVITGPNMAGKSTYMRQTALIVLMAQIGSFVPASSAEIGIVDQIFTRVGASDDLAAGQSTFMVEMTEVANILSNATEKSLLILDEIGRGTSTYDGLSIAWAVIEYIANDKKLGAKTLFATHYHELTELEGRVEGVKNYCIAVKKRGDDIIFLRKIIRGGADDSYGIEVAKLAGVSKDVIKRAMEIVTSLESNNINKTNIVNMDKHTNTKDEIVLPLFETNSNEIIKEISQLDVTTLTPIEALNKLYEFKQKCNSF